MPTYAVIDIGSNSIINYIIAEPDDPELKGFRLMHIPDGYYWDGTQLKLISDE